MSRLDIGTQVRTTKDAGSGGWAREAVTERAENWGKVGRVEKVSDSHGLVYRLRFGGLTDFWTTAWFEPEELEFPDGRPVVAVPERDAFDVLLDGYIL